MLSNFEFPVFGRKKSGNRTSMSTVRSSTPSGPCILSRDDLRIELNSFEQEKLRASFLELRQNLISDIQAAISATLGDKSISTQGGLRTERGWDPKTSAYLSSCHKGWRFRHHHSEEHLGVPRVSRPPTAAHGIALMDDDDDSKESVLSAPENRKSGSSLYGNGENDDDRYNVSSTYVPLAPMQEPLMSQSEEDGETVDAVREPTVYSVYSTESGKEDLPRRSTRRKTTDILRGRNTTSLTLDDGIEGYDSDDPFIPLYSFVRSNSFSTIVAVMVMLNAFYIGFQTDYMARNWTESLPPAFFGVDAAFCVIFLVEITLRMCTYGASMWAQDQWRWTIFDFILVLLQVVDVCIALVCHYVYISPFSQGPSSTAHHLMILRLMRIFRLFRVLRIIRLMSIFTDLRMLIVTVAESMRSLFWTMMMVILVMYVCGVYLTQIVTDHKTLNTDRQRARRELEAYYGTLTQTMLTLYETISEGTHWSEVMAPLRDDISPWMAFVFSAYIAFAIFAMMNVITGIFVESALVIGNEDKKKTLMYQMRELFSQADTDKSGILTWDKFKDQLQSPQMEKLLKVADLEVEEAHDLFILLDVDECDAITVNDFVNGCTRVAGNAKAIDLLILMSEYRWDQQYLMDNARWVQEILVRIETKLTDQLLLAAQSAQHSPRVGPQHRSSSLSAEHVRSSAGSASNTSMNSRASINSKAETIPDDPDRITSGWLEPAAPAPSIADTPLAMRRSGMRRMSRTGRGGSSSSVDRTDAHIEASQPHMRTCNSVTL